MRTFKVLSITHKTANTFVLRTERPELKIRAGQCFNIGVPGMGINREYSMYSNAEAPYLEFLIRCIDDGLVSSHLQKLKVGDDIEIDGPYGEFCLRKEALNDQYYFICTGTGIAPFHSFIKTFPYLDYYILHGVRNEEERYDFDHYASEKYRACISLNLKGQSLRVTDALKVSLPRAQSWVYLCGNRNMIVESVEILLENSFSGNQIITEVFF